MNNVEWILLDTETNGIKAPVYVVELAAQRMSGWEPEGKPFQRLLNHNTDIPAEASRVNGYTREILERDGAPPLEVYREFSEYVKKHPLASYNLNYDFDQVLMPEWQRLGIEPIGRPGFCVLRLAQRLLDPIPAGNHKLQTLRQFYRLPARGAHTALGDVETVVDLMQKVLQPIAEQQGLTTWEEIKAFADALWYPSRIAFGKFKGRHFRDALKDSDLYDWLKWLASSTTPRSADMGRWYLQQLNEDAKSPAPGGFVVDSAVSNSSEVVIYQNPELSVLRQLIEGARSRLADIESEYAHELYGVEVAQSKLFNLLRHQYQRRDELRLVIQYRRVFIETLILGGEEEAEEVKPQYDEARAETDRDYEEAASKANESQKLNEVEEKELKTLFRKLVRLYHPDRFANDPEKQEIYTRLTSAINEARDRGDIKRLREIANDTQGFLIRQGWGSLDLDDRLELSELRRHLENLQSRILSKLADLAQLRESHGYELYSLSQQRPEFIQVIASQQTKDIEAEIAALDIEAKKLAEEIENLTGASDAIGT